MIDGIYHVTFSSVTGDTGEGLIVVKENSINGGDHGYLFTGTKTGDAAEFQCTLKIKQWNRSVQSIFGLLEEFTLTLHGKITEPDNSFMALGNIIGQPQAKIIINGKYLSVAS